MRKKETMKGRDTEKEPQWGEGFNPDEHWKKLYIKADKLAHKEMFKRRGAERKIKLLESKIKAMKQKER